MLTASVSVDELFRMASASRQVRHEPGTVLAQEGSVPTIVHILIDGRVTVATREEAGPSVDAPAALGFIEAMAGLAMPDTIRTTGSAVTLALTVEELRTLLADNTDLVSGLFATLAERSSDAQNPVRRTGAGRELEQLAQGGGTSIERVLAHKYVTLISRVSTDEMQHVAGVTAPVKLAAGSVLFRESAPPALWLLLSGEVTLESPTGEPGATAHGGDIIGSSATGFPAPGRLPRPWPRAYPRRRGTCRP